VHGEGWFLLDSLDKKRSQLASDSVFSVSCVSFLMKETR
jgi:hypothetical protein